MAPPTEHKGISVIAAPSKGPRRHAKSIFLAGTTTATGNTNWRHSLTKALSNLCVDVYNPLRLDWDETWTEDDVARQVGWELEMQETADFVVFFFHHSTDAPVSLLELGLCVRSGKAIVCVDDEYSKRVNVLEVCKRYNVPVVNSEAALSMMVMDVLQRSGVSEVVA